MGLKNQGFNVSLHEYDYSLHGDDARRFQGQCKMWNDEMGITEELIRAYVAEQEKKRMKSN